MTTVAIQLGGAFSVIDALRDSVFAGDANTESILKDCLLRSVEVRRGFVDGKLACIWGLIPPTVLSDRAWLWLLTTPLVSEHKFLFVRYSQRYIEEVLKTYPIIVGECTLGNLGAMRWIRWLGGRFGSPFRGAIPFEIRKP